MAKTATKDGAFSVVVCKNIENKARQVQRLEGQKKKALDDRRAADKALGDCDKTQTKKYADLSIDYQEADRKHKRLCDEHTKSVGDLLERVFNGRQDEFFLDENTFKKPEPNEVGGEVHDPNAGVGAS